MQDFFDNTITSSASTNDILNILGKPRLLTKWDNEVRRLEPTGENQAFTIVRNQAAINTTERLTVRQIADTIIYDIQGNRLSYQVQFTVHTAASTAVLDQRVLIDKNNLPHLPLSLLRPIAKHALLTNLRALVVFAERWSADIEERL
ncbi:hypothetical protein ACFQ5M_12255 [Agrilactobacillus yilanensis]|uniref:SRPBCC family protein n=1 Tax=Agrilactobacillus yilanensis TaxID=2485997 RepID=A0ABW4JB74_9LACO|nr:hypothetical protein [Agrilactobacillus yilanensis]